MAIRTSSHKTHQHPPAPTESPQPQNIYYITNSYDNPAEDGVVAQNETLEDFQTERA